MYTLAWTPHFIKEAKRFARKHPELKKQTGAALAMLERDPFHPGLKLHQLKGSLKGIHAVHITYSYRITLVLRVTEKTVTLLDIGEHDTVYR